MMEQQVVQVFELFGPFAPFMSVLVGIVVSVVGVLPSTFVTVANLVYFGLWMGTLLSFVGEVLGAGCAFLLWKGLRYALRRPLPDRFARLRQKLEAQKGREAFLTILLLRLLPFVPSGIVNIVSAASGVSILLFLTASTLGKIPAMLLEVLAVHQFMQSSTMMQWSIAGIALAYYLIYRVYQKRTSSI
ncbi:VTT domain-containing protein [Exiguobacterium sp. SL14]|nr:VTT domain-containing protein [Exiguobacterium sp. SL14]MCY1692119.1 VTT domain-containing protein [Exiguobacterium sp. SL14]